MSHMEIRSCQLLTYDKDLMIQAINLLQQKLGGPGLLNKEAVKGYGKRKEKAELVFHFPGMAYDMGIRISDSGVEFVGDPYRSRNWNQIQEELIHFYKVCGVQYAYQKRRFAQRVTSDTERGTTLEGFR